MGMTISKWGNSLGVRIPSHIAKEAGIEEGTPVQISAIKGRIVLEPLKYDLKSLVGGISAENRHAAVETGAPIGQEIW